MATEEQRQLASLALVLIAAVGVVLAALSGRSVQGMSPMGAGLSGLGRNRGSVGSYGSIGSVGSYFSIGSVGSAFSIGSVGSAFSIGSFFGLGTVVAVLSALSFGGCLQLGYCGLPYGLGQATCEYDTTSSCSSDQCRPEHTSYPDIAKAHKDAAAYLGSSTKSFTQ